MTKEEFWNIGSSLFEGGLINFILHSIFVIVVTSFIVRLVRKAFKKHKELSDTKNPLIFSYIQKTLVTILYGIGLFLILYSITPFQGIGKAALGATSILAVGVSLAAQESFSNFIAGFFLALYHPFKEGDYISLPEKNISGYVKEISLRHIVIVTMQNTTLFIPNNVMNSAVLENKGYQDARYSQFEYIGVSYDSDIDQVKKVICSVLEKTEGIIDIRTEEQKENKEPIDIVIISEFDSYSITMRYCVRTNSLKSYWNVAPKVRQGILEEFRKQGIEIPYPITTVINK